MTLTETKQQNGAYYRSLTECPCGEPIDVGTSLRVHLLNDHVPEDFGLTPMSEP